LWFRWAHRRVDLFKKYFIQQIGGHVGLELPSECLARWQKNGFIVKRAIKIWGLIWPIQDYAGLFDNEYQEDSAFLKIVVGVSKFFSRYRLLKIVMNIILNPFNSLIESFLPLNNGQGLMLVCWKQKKY
jgi:hypothetical protein